MITSIRVEASGDDPGDVKRLIDDVLLRAGQGVGRVTDEVYERKDECGGYRGRVKVLYDTPMNARDEEAYDAETATIREFIEERLSAGCAQNSIEVTGENFGSWGVAFGGDVANVPSVP